MSVGKTGLADGKGASLPVAAQTEQTPPYHVLKTNTGAHPKVLEGIRPASWPEGERAQADAIACGRHASVP